MLVTTELSLPMTDYSNSYKQEPQLSFLSFNKKFSGLSGRAQKHPEGCFQALQESSENFGNCPTLLILKMWHEARRISS